MEKWKTIEGFPLYKISSKGRVKSYHTYEDGKILKGGYDKDGYHLVLLYENKKRYTKKVHRLVAEAFIGNTEGLQVNHKNGIKSDNRVENLELVTCSENHKHAYRELNRESKFTKGKRPVAKIDLKTGEIIKVYDSLKETTKDGYHRQSVGRVCRNERKHHKGYNWEYLENVQRLSKGALFSVNRVE